MERIEMKAVAFFFAAFVFGIAFLPVAFAAKPAEYYVSDGTTTDPDGNVVEKWRPMTQKEFSDYIAARYAGNYTGNIGNIDQLQSDWEAARREWNQKNPDRPIVSDEDDPDFDYGDDDSGDPNDPNGGDFNPTEDDVRKLLARKDQDDNPDSDDYGGIYDATEGGTKTKDGTEYGNEYQNGAINNDKDEDSTSNGLKDSAELEGADGNTKMYSFDLAAGGVDPSSKSLSGLFNGLGFLPFVNETDEEARKLVGTPSWTEEMTLRKVKTSAFPLYQAQGWNITVLRGRKHGKADILLTRKHEGTGLYKEEVDEPSAEPDWNELGDAPDNYLDEASFADFDWNYGGFGGGDSVWGGDPGNGSGPVIGNLKMGRDGLSFEYENGLSGWGLADNDADALACLFVLDKDGKWVGGKFEWISTSRKTRDFENIYSGYGGWNLSNVPKTTTAAFVIVSKDGKWRSNVIVGQWER